MSQVTTGKKSKTMKGCSHLLKALDEVGIIKDEMYKIVLDAEKAQRAGKEDDLKSCLLRLKDYVK